MKYKVGDRVKIKSLDWYNRHTNGTEIDCGGVPFTSGMKWFCSCVMTISFVHADCYTMVEDLENYYTDEMIEGLVEEEEIEFTEEDKYWCDIMSESDPTTYVLPQGYQFKDENGNVINATKIVLEKKKKEYPKTYEECSLINGDEGRISLSIIGKFTQLINARNAYWKIAGDEMGLEKPWEYDCKSDYFAFAIIYRNGWIQKVGIQHKNAILAFPTEEMRNAFKENFDTDIEICKEFL